jgi:glutaminyl-tRNA synthetase
VIHWVDAARALPAELRLYDRLFRAPAPDAEADFRDALNPESVVTMVDARVEPSVAGAEPASRYQFERKGYFAVDPDSTGDRLVFNRIVTLRDSWGSAQTRAEPPATAEADRPAAQPSGKGTRPIRRSRAEHRERARERDPELAARTRRYREELGLGDDDAELIAGDAAGAAYFEAALAAHDSPKTVAKLVINEVLPILRDEGVSALGVSAEAIAELASLIDDATLTATLAKDVLAHVREQGKGPKEIVRERGLTQIADPAELQPLVDRIVAANADKAEAYRRGKTGLLGFFVGQVMKETGGKANAEIASQLVRDSLAGG